MSALYRTGLLALALLLAGCASAGGVGAGGEGSVAVVVENNLIPPTSLSVYAVPETGSRQLIGTVAPSETKTLQFNPVGVSGQYRFVAEGTAGQDYASNPVTLSGVSRIRWDLTSGIATVVR